ncbi:hypothetical protein F2Q69_00041439 [Brassica cretica]|uniref:Uncharacterized protein n=1 Tax=Brassica cretica TaxID=69181 RepID=A0A8S9NRF1_BRACR|nr:hypothetical protein F2Q69_00041439 [Brassica cretica]
MKQAGWIRCISPFRVYSRKVMEVFEMLDTKSSEGDGHGGNDGKYLVSYTGAPSSRNNDHDYIRRSDLDALFKMLKENGNTYGYSFGASMIAYKIDKMARELVNAKNDYEFSHIARTDTVTQPHLDHEGGEEPMQEVNSDGGGVENEGEESIRSDDHDHGVIQTPSQDEVIEEQTQLQEEEPVV